MTIERVKRDRFMDFSTIRREFEHRAKRTKLVH